MNLSLIKIKLLTYVKTLLMAFACLSMVLPVHGQGNGDLRKSLNHMFRHINRQKVPTGLLIDYAVEDADLSMFSGGENLNDDNICTPADFVYILETVKSAALDINHDPTRQFISEISSRAGKKSGQILISVALFNYAQIKANALKDKLIQYRGGQVYCNNSEAYQLRTMFAGCCLNSSTVSEEVTLRLPTDYILTNLKIKDVAIDCGHGYSSIFNRTVKAKLSKGVNNIKICATTSDGRKYYSHTTISFVPENNGLTRTSIPDRRFDKIQITGSGYNGVVTSADVTIMYNHNNYTQKLKKPFVFVEGFDPRVFMSGPNMGSMSYDFIYEKFRKFLNDNNYDFIYVDWVKSEEYIQANAQTLISVIKEINSRMQSDSEPIVLLGHSMGGLIARYALKTMDNNNQTHNVGAYISYDAPHLGAHIPVGLLYGYNGIKEFFKEKKILDKISNWFFDDFKSYIRLGDAMAYSTAAQQMLVNYVDPAGNLNNQEHYIWQKELNELGFPKGDKGKEFKMLAVANGNYDKPKVPETYLSVNLFASIDSQPVSLFRTVDVSRDLIGIIVGVALQDVIVGMISALPGKDAIVGDININPAVASDQHVTHIKVRYKKNFLWVVPISKTVFSYDRYYNGTLLYDTYPSSIYGIKEKNIDSKNLGSPYLAEYGYAFNKMSRTIPFIPTSSALACGNGLSMKPSTFESVPNGDDTPFGENYYIENAARNHVDFSSDAQNWIKTRLGTAISGPASGYDGAKYELSNSAGIVSWNSTNTSVATINSHGVLSVKSNGTTQITATYQGQKYSKDVVVGIPRYVLSADHVPGGYKIEATCIDNQFKPDIEMVNRTLQFQWGVKFPDSEIEWISTNSPSLMVQMSGKEVSVFFKVKNNNDEESVAQTIKAEAEDVYNTTDADLLIDANGGVYDKVFMTDMYDWGRIYINRNEYKDDKYNDLLWQAFSAVIISPFAKTYTVNVDSYGLLIKDVIPKEEVGFITSNADEGQKFVYTLLLRNAQDEVIQFLPITFTYKSVIE